MNSSALNRFFLIFSLILVVIGVVTGFWLLGSPGLQRKLKADDQRLNHLYQIASSLHQESNLHEDFQLPNTLAPKDYTVDPVSGQSYQYQVINDNQYQLCADFATDSQKNNQNETSYRQLREFWQHSQGKNCFNLDVKEAPPTIYE